jgi:hypothetical protein
MPQQDRNVSYFIQKEETSISVHKHWDPEYQSLTDGPYTQGQQQLYEMGYMYTMYMTAIKGNIGYISHIFTNRLEGPSSQISSYPLHMKTATEPISKMQ